MQNAVPTICMLNSMASSENFTTGVTNEHDNLVWYNIPAAPTVVRSAITSSTSLGLLNTQTHMTSSTSRITIVTTASAEHLVKEQGIWPQHADKLLEFFHPGVQQ